MLQAEKKSRAIPKWIEWVLVVVMLGLAAIEFNHGERFWAGMFVVMAVALGATSFFVRSKDGSHGE